MGWRLLHVILIGSERSFEEFMLETREERRRRALYGFEKQHLWSCGFCLYAIYQEATGFIRMRLSLCVYLCSTYVWPFWFVMGLIIFVTILWSEFL